jgi:enterochelin esterase family protein
MFSSRTFLVVILLVPVLATGSATARQTDSIADVLYQTLSSEGLAAARAQYERLRESASSRYDFGASDLNRLGYRLINDHRLEQAIAVLEINANAWPDNPNVYDSLAEAYRWAREYERALPLYRRVLDLLETDSTLSVSLRKTLRDNAMHALDVQMRLKTKGYRAVADGRTRAWVERPAESVRSPRIERLRRDVEGGDPGAVDVFRAELASRGAPLVEYPDGQDEQAIVTFVWFAERDRDHVVLEAQLGGRDPRDRRLERLGGTDLWFRSFRLPRDVRLAYLISPDDRRISPWADLATYSMVTSDWRVDPLNPRRSRGEGNLTWSVLQTRYSPSTDLIERNRANPAGRIQGFTFQSEHLGNERTIKVYTPPGYDPNRADAYPVLYFFDGYGYVESDSTNILLDNLTSAGMISPVVAVFIYNAGDRNREMSCYPPMHAFLAEELVPSVRDEFRVTTDPLRTVIGGRSRSGLGAACAAVHNPDIFGNVLSQSGAFWWAPEGEEWEWLARQLATSDRLPINFYIEAGQLEISPNPETGLNMLTVSRHLRDVLTARGYVVHYREFPGAHEPIVWRVTLADGLRALLDPVDEP